MALPAKKQKGTAALPQNKKDPTKKKLNKPIGGLSKGQMTGTEESEELKALPKAKTKKSSKGGGGTGLY